MKVEDDYCSECCAQDVPCVALGESPYMQSLCETCLAQAYLKLREAATSKPCSELPEMVSAAKRAHVFDGFARPEFEFPRQSPAPKERVEVLIDDEWKPATFATKGWDIPAWTGFQLVPTGHNVYCSKYPQWRHRADAKYKGTCNAN